MKIILNKHDDNEENKWERMHQVIDLQSEIIIAQRLDVEIQERHQEEVHRTSDAVQDDPLFGRRPTEAS